MKKNNLNAENIVLDIMRHFGFRRNYQVAEYFNVTPQTLSGWMKSGEIPPKHLMKYKDEILNKNKNKEFFENIAVSTNIERKSLFDLLYKNKLVITLLPLMSVMLTSMYVFLISDQIYTSKSKVLPISEDGSTSSSFSGFASQLGISIPLNIGGKVPWDEIYPEILKSSDLLKSLLNQKYSTNKYGDLTLLKILIREKKLDKYNEINRQNRAINQLRKMILITKDRSSPIVNINVNAFEPMFAFKLSEDLIEKSSIIQRQLKTRRVKQKRLFIEERLDQVALEMKEMEKELREFRENNRNLSSSPSLQMKVQEMGREADLQNSLYVTLKTEYEKAKIDEVGRDDMVQQIDGPSIPMELSSPKITLSIFLSIFFGIFCSFITIYFRDHYQNQYD